MTDFYSLDQILEVNRGELPASKRGLNLKAKREGWSLQVGKSEKASRRGGGLLYHVSLLPGPVQARLSLAAMPEQLEQNEERQAAWLRFEGLSKAQKTRCEARLNLLHQIEKFKCSGMSETTAARLVANTESVSVASLFNWKAKLAGFDRSDWLAALAPQAKKKLQRVDCHSEAYKALTSDFLRPEMPTFSSCYRRMVRAANNKGWEPIPTERSLRRHIDQDVTRDVQKLARLGRERTKSLYPAQQRDRSHFHAMQAVNMDGHKFDVFVKMPDSRIIRPCLVGIQDLYSGKIVAWRLAENENKETVRLVIGDMVEAFGIPEKMFLDNGRAFASKWITGGAKTRFRFKIREEEPQGLLTTLGVETVWTTPYSGQSKPIERAWRDLADTISRHPACAGAWTGNTIDAKPENYGNAAIPYADFVALIEQEIPEHNARTGRKATAVRGRSFDQAFDESLALDTTIVAWPTKAQKSLWLLAAEQIRAQRGNGEIHFFENRYWSPALTGFAGKKVTVRFDPDHLRDGVKVYDLNDQLICEAECFVAAGFDDVDAARVHNSKRKAFEKALRDGKRLAQEMSADELTRLYSSDDTPTTPQPAKPTKVTRIAGANALAAKQAEPEWDEEAEEGFSKGLRLVADNEF
ncbi:MAG: transposase domain-containing protein [Rhizobiaceae bacterium]